MTGNANFPSPSPSLAAFDTTITTLAAKKTARDNAFEAAKAATADLHDAEQAYDLSVSQLAAYAEAQSPATRRSSKAPASRCARRPEPIIGLDMVTDLKVTSNSYSGVLFARWKPLRGAKSYEVQLCADPVVEANWRSIKPSPASKTEIDDLTSGAKIWVRVRAWRRSSSARGASPPARSFPSHAISTQFFTSYLSASTKNNITQGRTQEGAALFLLAASQPG